MKKIICVEDRSDKAAILSRLLLQAGIDYSIYENYYSGRTAILEAFNAGTLGAVITDWNFPRYVDDHIVGGMGEELIHAVKFRHPELPIAVFSGGLPPERLSDAVRAVPWFTSLDIDKLRAWISTTTEAWK